MPSKADSQMPLLSRLANYYLACLGKSSRPEVSFFARNKYGNDYIELQGNPFMGSTSMDEGNDASRIFSMKGKNDKELYVGHLVFADYVKSNKSDWEGYILYPLLISPYEGERNLLDATQNQISVNPAALKKLTGLSSSAELQDAILEFEEEIGLISEDGEQISFDESLNRLRDRYSFWPWVEQISEAIVDADGKEIVPAAQTKLDQISNAGLYNRSLLFAAERQKFTVGLERELKDLGILQFEKYANTALAGWLVDPDESQVESSGSPLGPLLEPIPLNSEQRDAVNQSLTQKLTVITGPPGTGKSQVVSTILINAAYRGESILFSSKNNKAVDVVEQRINSLGKRPLLLRLGARNLQDRLSDYLTRLTQKDTSPDEILEFKSLAAQYSKIGEKVLGINSEIKDLIGERNKLDELDSQMDLIRQQLGVSAISEVGADWIAKLEELVSVAQITTSNYFCPKGLLARMFPSIGKQNRFSALQDSIEVLNSHLAQYAINAEVKIDAEGEVDTFIAGAADLATALRNVANYTNLLEKIESGADLGELSKQLANLQLETSKQSVKLWQSWLRTLPDRLDASNRKILNTFKTTVELLARTSDSRSATTLRAEQQKMFSSVLEFLPAWAVTSLSARGRVPFSPGMFDLVVIDEASQCDIASALPLLFRAKRAVIIGDPLQLKHVASIDGTTDRILLDQFGLMKNLEWSYSAQSLYDLASSVNSNNSTIILRDHHRSDAEIIEFSNSSFYDGQLRVATKHESLIRPKNMESAIRWIETTGQGIRPRSGSVVCREEAEEVVNEIQRLADQGYQGTIGVVTPFVPQSKLILDLVAQADGLKTFLNNADFNVSTAHGFQGDERDLIIMSLALQPGTPESAMKFVASQSNLFNVAVTRARAALVVVGDSRAKEIQKVPFVADFVTYLNGLGSASRLENASTLSDYGSKYPQDRMDNTVSDYEISFYEALYEAGIKTIPQWREDQYRLDLALFQGNRKLDIEIDGENYHRSWTGENVRRDLIRNQRLIELGWDVQRFWVYQIIENPEKCIARVKKWFEI